MLEIINHTRYKINISLIKKIASTLTHKSIELIFVKNKQMQEINLQHCKKDYPTDVLSFPLESFGIDKIPLGSIVINIDKAKEVSENLNHSLDSEIALLFIHACLHLLGYDHQKDKGEHRAKEQELIKFFNLPKSLILRNE